MVGFFKVASVDIITANLGLVGTETAASTGEINEHTLFSTL